MTLAVVLTTYQSPLWLEKSLWGYLNQSYRDFQLLIADDGSSDETAAVVHRYAAQGLTLRHLWQADCGFRKSRILNRAIAAAEADYLVFSDGDCIPHRDFLAIHAALAAPGRFLSGGYVKLSMQTSRTIDRVDVAAGRALSVPWLWMQGTRNLRRMAKLAVPGWMRPVADALTPTRASWNGHNASGWRHDLIAANGFDERMGYGGQDRELGERLEHAGIRGKCIRHRALCVHLDHARGYAELHTIRKNREIRHQTRTGRITRTPHGISSLPPEAGPGRGNRPL